MAVGHSIHACLREPPECEKDLGVIKYKRKFVQEHIDLYHRYQLP